MALQTSASAGLSGQYQKYFSKKLLPYAVQALVLDQFGQKVPFPKGVGATTIRFTRPDAPDDTQVVTASEGVAINTFRNTTLTFIDATLVQYVEAIKISDVLTWTELFNTLDIGITQMGQDVAIHADKIVRNELVSAVTGAGNKRYAQGLATWAALAAASVSAGSMTITDVLDAMTRLTITRAPKKNGEYVMAVPAQVARDLMNDSKFILAGQYGTTKGLLKGEVGTWYGVRIVVTTNAFVENGANAGTEGTYDASGTAANSIYVSFAMGTDAFGIPMMAGNSPYDPKVMICDKPDKSDPANQFVTAAIKTYWTAKTLNATWAVAVRSKTQYV